jgi:hypothetical protein
MESRKLIAESELECAKMYSKTAELMKSNKGTLELTYFETLKEISDNRTHAMILPSKMIFLHDQSPKPERRQETEEISENKP